MNSYNDIIHAVAKNMRRFETSIDSLQRKQTGSYYTSLELSIDMMRELIQKLPQAKRDCLYSLRFLEPCVGMGSFVFAYLFTAKELGFTKEQYRELLNNIYVCDVNDSAIIEYKRIFQILADKLFAIKLDDNYFYPRIGNALLFDVDSEYPRYISIDEIFGEGSENSFDIVATNPPYKNLRAERSHYLNDSALEADKIRYKLIAEAASDNLCYSAVGVLNLYKLFVEEILERYVTKDGHASLLIPSSLLTDKTCEKLRTRLLDICAIKSIKTMGEESQFIDAQQAVCALLITKDKANTDSAIEITTDYRGKNEEVIQTEINDIISASLCNAILTLTKDEFKLFNSMNKYPKIKDLDYIVNMRGELDLTANKNSITENQTPYLLLRGRNIGYYCLENVPSGEYITSEFINSTAKKGYIVKERLICQQISNMAKERRLIFTVASPNMALGNSCNFVSVKDNDHGVDLMFLLGILNSSLMNWYFKLQSGNNHINNYEIDNLPIPIECEQKSDIAMLAKQCLESPQNQDLLEEIDALVTKAFLGKSPDDKYQGLIEGSREDIKILRVQNIAPNVYEYGFLV